MMDCWVSPGWVEETPLWVDGVCGGTPYPWGHPKGRPRRTTQTVRALAEPDEEDEELIALLEATYNG